MIKFLENVICPMSGVTVRKSGEEFKTGDNFTLLEDYGIHRIRLINSVTKTSFTKETNVRFPERN